MKIRPGVARVFLAFGLLLLFCSNHSPAQIPRTLSYQGVLTDSLGHPKPDGGYDLTFRLYQVSSAGSPVWSEAKTLQVKQGLFSTILGDETAFADSLKFDRPYWLSIQVGTDAELSPRIPLSSVAYSIRAMSADSVRIAGSIPDNIVTTQKIADGTIQRADVAPGFTSPFADTAAYARVAPQGGFVDSARIAGSIPDNTVTTLKILNGTIQRSDVQAGFKAPYADTSDFAHGAPPVGTAGGDLVSNFPSPVVQGLQGRPVASGAPSNGQVLKWNGSAWTPGRDSVGKAIPWDTSGADVYNTNDGGVGIGTSTPGAKLDVQGADIAINSTGNIGLWATSQQTDGTALLGEADSGEVAYGVWGRSVAGYAGYFDGNVAVTGTLSKPAGSFKIDHPLDPANKYLYHSFVESPDMKNIYDGVATLDQAGKAVVILPGWFGALNKDYRYQLTCIGDFAPVFIAQKISDNRFTIAGGKPGMEVSWQVTGVRQDPYANAHRIPVEQDKRPAERGKYLYPKEYGMPETMGVNHDRKQKLDEKVRAKK